MLSLEPFTEDQGRSAVHPLGDPANQLPCALRVYSPVDSHTCQTPWSVFQDGPNGEPAGRRQEHAVPRHATRARAASHDRGDDMSTSISTAQAWAAAAIRVGPRPESIGRTGSSPFHIRPGRIAGPHPLPSRQFQALFDSLFKVLFIFPSRYLFAIGLSPIFSLGRNLPPDLGCILKQPDSPTAPRGATGSEHNGALTLSGAPFQGTWARSVAEDASPDYNSDAEGDRFSWWAVPGSLARVIPPDLGSRWKHPSDAMGSCEPFDGRGTQDWLREELNHRVPWCSPPRTRIWANRESSSREANLRPTHDVCFDNDPSAGSPTETLLRLLLPLNDKVQWTSRDVAGSEPPTSPRSEHFTGPFNR
ncbi:hypothetical protein L6164_037925 [Bauhinia variegata]|nr:hypothetical protein L6164_037925 [Bauhinia variegata]